MSARAAPSPGRPVETGFPQSEGVRETIDSIVIAFILAFVFRAFIVEAFVIPTGSMAATLNGAHGTMICRNCGWEFAYGLSESANTPRGFRVNENSIAFCPNCRFPNQTVETNDVRGNYESGDRILVLKWPFDIGVPALGPQRWNVIVFKDPSDGTTNYIKRLAGLPNEVLEILDGDVYTAPVEELSQETLDTLHGLRHVKYLLRTGEDVQEALRLDQQLREPLGKVLNELDAKLRIQRKAPLAQQDLWRVAYNHDYPPRERRPDQPRWVATESVHAWSVEQRTLRFDGLNLGEQEVHLEARVDSFCPYNTVPARGSTLRATRPDYTPVSDTRTRFVIDYRAGEGAVSVKLTKRSDIFIGKLQADGTALIRRARTDAPGDFETLCTTRVNALTPGRKVAFSFENLDHRVRMHVDGREVLVSTDEQYSPNVAALRAAPTAPSLPPSISARNIQIELSHVVVESDVYYLSEITRDSAPLRYKAWGTRNNPILLRPGEYFMLGDNSAQSKDSRLWNTVGPHLVGRGEDYQLGTVPRDQLIGRAFFVYWPSGLRTSLIPFLKEWGWIPNFGRMRWIR